VVHRVDIKRVLRPPLGLSYPVRAVVEAFGTKFNYDLSEAGVSLVEKKEYKVDDIMAVSYVIQILDLEFDPVQDTEFKVTLDEVSETLTTDSSGLLKVRKPKSGELKLAL